MMSPDPQTAYSPCRLCPRQCGTDRLGGAPGVCGETTELRIASWGPHLGEEPCFTGTRGSGTIFFSGCSCHCFFCQNWQISSAHGKGHAAPDLPPPTFGLPKPLRRQFLRWTWTEAKQRSCFHPNPELQ